MTDGRDVGLLKSFGPSGQVSQLYIHPANLIIGDITTGALSLTRRPQTETVSIID